MKNTRSMPLALLVPTALMIAAMAAPSLAADLPAPIRVSAAKVPPAPHSASRNPAEEQVRTSTKGGDVNTESLAYFVPVGGCTGQNFGSYMVTKLFKTMRNLEAARALCKTEGYPNCGALSIPTEWDPEPGPTCDEAVKAYDEWAESMKASRKASLVRGQHPTVLLMFQKFWKYWAARIVRGLSSRDAEKASGVTASGDDATKPHKHHGKVSVVSFSADGKPQIGAGTGGTGAGGSGSDGGAPGDSGGGGVIYIPEGE